MHTRAAASTQTARDASIPWHRALRPGERAAPPGWDRRFRAAWDSPCGGDGLPDDLGPAEVARPLLAHAQHRLRDRLATELARPELAVHGFANLADLLCAEPPLAWLGMAVGPAVAHELAEEGRAGRLTGATPQERYADFARRLADPDRALEIWRTYPVLARHVLELLEDWVRARADFARHLASDLPTLAETFAAGAGLGALEEVRFGAAETHRGGRGVALVRFTGAAIVYKPRSLAVDRCFDGLLGWFNEGSPPYVLRRTRVLDRADHGWAEHIAAEPCARPELPGYFWRTGALLALTHLLHGFDLHADNVIAAGAQPVVIDLEGLFHTEETRPMLTRAGLGDPAVDRLAGSVLRTGLLPGPLVVPDLDTGRPFGVDASPLGASSDRRSLIPVPIVDDAGTDRMRIRLGHRTVPAPAGRLRVADGGAADPARFRDDLVAGYACAYERLRSAGEWLMREGPLARCADVPVRLIQLSTFLYVRLLLDSWHPDALRDATVRERGLARLEVGWPLVPHRAELVGAELAALRRGEVPTFEVRPGHRDVRLEDGTRLRGVLRRSPLRAVRDRLARMGPADLAAQVALIDASIATLPGATTAGPVTPARSTTASGEAPSRDALVDRAVRIAGLLRATAVRSGDRIGWVTLEVVDARSRRVAQAGLDLYGGLPGIGLFLSYLSSVTGRGWVRDLADEVAEEVVRRILAAAALDLVPRGTTAGAFGPLLGPVYYLAHAAAAHRNPRHAEFARDVLLPAVPRALAARGSGDVAEGTAGAVLALLALHAALPDGDVLAMARAAGDRLLAIELTEAGFGYGASGAAVALTRLHALGPDPRYASAACALIAGEADPGREAGWCQGAAGTGLARLELMRSPVFAGSRRELRRALDRAAGIARNAPAPPDDSLCHGRFARLELLTALGDGVGDGAVILPVASGRRWRTALPEPAPGLFAGLAGIGFGLLRLAAPDMVPAVLALTPPAAPV